jgi:hypothetical protein
MLKETPILILIFFLFEKTFGSSSRILFCFDKTSNLVHNVVKNNWFPIFLKKILRPF